MPNVKFTVPSPYSQQAAEIDRRQKMAELLQQQAMEPMQQQVAGGKVIPISPLTGLTRILQSYTAQKQLKDLGYERAKLEQSDIDAARKMAEEFGRPTVELPIAQNDTTLRELNVRRVPSSTPGGLDQTQLVSPASESEIKSYLLPRALGAGVGPYQQKLAELLYTQKPEREEFGTTPVKGADGNYYLVGKSGTIRRTDISAPDTSEPPKTIGGMMWNPEARRYEPIPGYEEQARRIAEAGRGPDPLVQIVDENGQPTYVPRSQAIYKKPYAPASIRQELMEADRAKANRQAEISTQDTLDNAFALLNHPGRKAGTGASSWLSNIPGTDAKDFQAKLNTFKAQTFIPMVSALRGMGALSDAEGKKLSESVGALDPSMSESGFEDSLRGVIKVLFDKAKASGLQVTNPLASQSVNQPSLPAENTVVAPNGKTYVFSTPEQAAAFKQRIGPQ